MQLASELIVSEVSGVGIIEDKEIGQKPRRGRWSETDWDRGCRVELKIYRMVAFSLLVCCTCIHAACLSVFLPRTFSYYFGVRMFCLFCFPTSLIPPTPIFIVGCGRRLGDRSVEVLLRRRTASW